MRMKTILYIFYGKYHASVGRDHAIDYTPSIKWHAVGRRPFPMTELLLQDRSEKKVFEFLSSQFHDKRRKIVFHITKLIKTICPITNFSLPKNLSHFEMYLHEKLSL